MKKLFAILLIALIALSSTVFFAGCDKEEDEFEEGKLNVYNCQDYIDESIFEDFTEWYREKTGKHLEINYVTYDSNETMLAKMMNNDAGVDVICSSEYAIQKLYKNGLLLPISKTEGMNTVNSAIYDRTSAEFGEDFANYFVPYMYGTLGILYNADVFEENEIDIEEYGWSILWNAAECEALNGKILMKDSIRDTFAAGVMYLKEQDLLPEEYKDKSPEFLINCTDEELVLLVKEALIDQKKALKNYEVDFGKDDMINLHAYVDLAWSGDAMYAIEEAELFDVVLDYYVPEVGSNIWFDGWFIPSNCTNVEGATAFIEFMCLPDISARNMIEVGYSSAVQQEILKENDEVLALLEEAEYDVDDFFGWEVRYPEIDNPNYGMMADYGDRTIEMTIMWEEVKAASGGEAWGVWKISLLCLGVIVALLGIVCGIVLLVQHLRDDRRYL